MPHEGLYLARLEEMLAELIDLPTGGDYHRMRADLYAAVVAQLLIPSSKLTKLQLREIAEVALTAENYNPELRQP